MKREVRCRIELRAAVDSPGRIVGTLLELGRVASDRREVFTPGSVAWPANGVRLLAEHRGRQIMRFQPSIEGAEIRINEKLPDSALARELAAEIRAGSKSGLSIEFVSTNEAVVAGVREVRAALVDAAAVVATPAYDQARVEVRQRQGRRFWL